MLALQGLDRKGFSLKVIFVQVRGTRHNSKVIGFLSCRGRYRHGLRKFKVLLVFWLKKIDKSSGVVSGFHHVIGEEELTHHVLVFVF